MRVLLDTHAFLWYLADDPRISDLAREAISNDATICFLSVASLWEIGIKTSLGKLRLPAAPTEFLSHHLAENKIQPLEIKPEHAFKVPELPFFHKDPFDRMLVAQCICEELPLISKDQLFSQYAINRLW